MTEEESDRLQVLIGTRNPVRVFECRPVPVTMVAGLIRQRFASGVIEMIPDGGMAVHQADGSLLCVTAQAE